MKLLHPPDVTQASAWTIFVPGAVTSGFISSIGFVLPLSLLGPLLEYEAIVSSSRSIVFMSSVAPTVIDREDEPIPDKPSLSGPSLPAATLTVTPARVASSRILECMSSPSLPPFSWLVIPQDREMMSIPYRLSSTPGHAVSLLSIIHCSPFIADS